jgi:hypothetical protein
MVVVVGSYLQFTTRDLGIYPCLLNTSTRWRYTLPLFTSLY